MGEVFLLGAGFSKAVSNHMPLLSELSGEVKQRGPNFLTPSLATLGDNLEIWLSYLSQPQPWLRESENLRNRATALDVTETVKEVLDEKELLTIKDAPPPWLERLTKTWHETNRAVISLNYDTLVERSARTLGVPVDRLYPVPLTQALRRDASVSGSSPAETFTLFKLHGSTNWYYSGSADFAGEVIYYTRVSRWGDRDERTQRLEEAEKQSVGDKVPLIVPPTTEKGAFFQHESLRGTWARAAESLAQASTVVVIGYSLPATDLSLRLFLHQGRKTAAKELYIVNTDHRVVDRYRDLLGQAYVLNHDFVGKNAIQRYIDEMM